jgi:organic radical activating enzyme
MNLISVDNNWQDNVLNLDISLGNYCNYQCWYCWPGSNSGTHKFPELEVIKQNISHLINYYKEHTNKQVFDIHFCGGEPTHWKQLPQFVQFLKQEFNCLISMTSNGSKKMSWWQDNARYFDRVHLSCHHEYVNIEEYRNLCDYLYTQNVVASVSVMMDPRAWNRCMELVQYLKGSRKQWTIRYVEIVDATVQYSPEQLAVLAQHRARRLNPFFFLRNNKYHRSRITVKDSLHKKHKLQDNEILLRKLNNFHGWECSVGVHWIHVGMTGRLSGTCNQKLYGEADYYNLYDADFVNKFQPTIKQAVCEQLTCLCNIETVMPKRKISNNRIIPIYAD